MKTEIVKNNQLLIGAVIGLVAAVIGDLVLYVLAPNLGASLTFPFPPGSAPQRLGVMMIVASVATGAVAGTLLLWALGRFTQRPWTIFYVVSALFVLVSFAAPLSLDTDTTTKIVMALMHTVTGAAIVGALTWRARG